MELNYKVYDAVLDEYLDKCPPQADKMETRPLSEEESLTLRNIKATTKDFNCLIVELNVIVLVLKYLDADGLRCLACNFRELSNSLIEQRDRLKALRLTFRVVQPGKAEVAKINLFLEQSQERTGRIRKGYGAIPTNLEYSPIKEYLEIQQKEAFLDDLYDRFGNIRVIFEATKEKNAEKIKEYAEYIASVVRNAGRMDEYKPRLQEYNERCKNEEARERREKWEKAREERAKAKEGMESFRIKFYSAVTMLANDSSIRVSKKTVVQKINQYGYGVTFVLCCYVYAGRYMYRYLGDGDTIVERFTKARAFKDGAEASEAKRRMEGQNPDKAFCIAEIPKPFEP